MKTLLIFIIVLFSGVAMAHETHGWKHAEGSIGPAISGRYCPDMTQVWEIDKDNDGVMDGCLNILFIHERVHIKPIIIKDGKCKCPEGVI